MRSSSLKLLLTEAYSFVARGGPHSQQLRRSKRVAAASLGVSCCALSFNKDTTKRTRSGKSYGSCRPEVVKSSKSGHHSKKDHSTLSSRTSTSQPSLSSSSSSSSQPAPTPSSSSSASVDDDESARVRSELPRHGYYLNLCGDSQCEDCGSTVDHIAAVLMECPEWTLLRTNLPSDPGYLQVYHRHNSQDRLPLEEGIKAARVKARNSRRRNSRLFNELLLEDLVRDSENGADEFVAE